MSKFEIIKIMVKFVVRVNDIYWVKKFQRAVKI